MKLVVCAKSPGGSFIGLPSAEGYTVFSVNRKETVRPGDILSSRHWNDEEGDLLTVRNISTDAEVRVQLIDWSLTLDDAKALVAKLESTDLLAWHPPWPGA